MKECVSQAAARAGRDPAKPRFRAACFGMSGGPEDKAELLRESIAFLSGGLRAPAVLPESSEEK